MKRNEDFLLRCVGGENVLIPVGEAARSFNGLINLNSTGTFLWEKLPEAADGAELAAMLAREFEVDESDAHKDTQEFLEQLRLRGMLSD